MLDGLLFLTYDIQAKHLVTVLFRNTAHSREFFRVSELLFTRACVCFVHTGKPS